MEVAVNGKADAWHQTINTPRMRYETSEMHGTCPSRHTVRVKMDFLFHR
jgi:hypothetical protein